MLLACLRNVSPCLTPDGAMEDYDLHWTDTPDHDLDICELGDEEEWFASLMRFAVLLYTVKLFEQ